MTEETGVLLRTVILLDTAVVLVLAKPLGSLASLLEVSSTFINVLCLLATPVLNERVVAVADVCPSIGVIDDAVELEADFAVSVFEKPPRFVLFNMLPSW
jgi:hypothetical protein